MLAGRYRLSLMVGINQAPYYPCLIIHTTASPKSLLKPPWLANPLSFSLLPQSPVLPPQDSDSSLAGLRSQLAGALLLGKGGQGAVFHCGGSRSPEAIKIGEITYELHFEQAAREKTLGGKSGLREAGILTSKETSCFWGRPIEVLGKDVGVHFGDPDRPRMMLVQTMEYVEGISLLECCRIVRI